MSAAPLPYLRFRTLHESPIVRVRIYDCRAGCGGPAAEEESDANSVVLLHGGAFRKHFGRRSVTADVNQAVFFTKGSTYGVSHPADCGDRGTTFSVASRVLLDVVRELDPSVDERPERPFPFVIGPCETAVFWRHHELVQALRSAGERPLEPLRADVQALQLVADVLVAAFARHGLAQPRRRQSTGEDHAEMTEAAKHWLAARLSERVTLDDVARAVHSSPFHFARVFQRQAGVPVHRYLARLRLRAALERVLDGERDLADLALRLGFASHAHLTDSFRAEFGRTPSEVRRRARAGTLRETSKDLEA